MARNIYKSIKKLGQRIRSPTRNQATTSRQDESEQQQPPSPSSEIDDNITPGVFRDPITGILQLDSGKDDANALSLLSADIWSSPISLSDAEKRDLIRKLYPYLPGETRNEENAAERPPLFSEHSLKLKRVFQAYARYRQRGGPENYWWIQRVRGIATYYDGPELIRDGERLFGDE